MRQAAARRGLLIASTARQVTAADFETFDHIFAMDAENLRTLMRRAPVMHRDKIRLFRDLDPDAPGADVPDPYYGGDEGFDTVLDIVMRTSRAWLDELGGDTR
jgi:protein-tyrosine phosphatase